MEKQSKTTWQILSAIDCSEHVEKKKTGRKTQDGKDEYLSYLSWVWAWGILKQSFPDATYSVREWKERPYLFDENLGYLVETSVTIEGETLTMRLPVMDGANKAMKNVPYTYKTRSGEKTVDSANMFDINTAIMRCLTKNLALFGLGHYIYAGEDLPKAPEISKEEKIEEVMQILPTIDNLNNLNAYFKSLPKSLQCDKSVIDAFSMQKINIQQSQQL